MLRRLKLKAENTMKRVEPSDNPGIFGVGRPEWLKDCYGNRHGTHAVPGFKLRVISLYNAGFLLTQSVTSLIQKLEKKKGDKKPHFIPQTTVHLCPLFNSTVTYSTTKK